MAVPKPRKLGVGNITENAHTIPTSFFCNVYTEINCIEYRANQSLISLHYSWYLTCLLTASVTCTDMVASMLTDLYSEVRNPLQNEGMRDNYTCYLDICKPVVTRLRELLAQLCPSNYPT